MERRAFLCTALAFTALPACGSGEPASDPALADVVFQGAATPAALESLLAMTPQGVVGKGAVVDMPVDDSILPKSMRATFSWHVEGGAKGTTGSFLVFSTTKNPQLLRVFTTASSYTPDERAWGTLGKAMVWTKLTIVSADLDGDQVVPGSGPYTGEPIEFCIDG